MRDQLGAAGSKLFGDLGPQISGLQFADVLCGQDVVLEVVESNHYLRGVSMAELRPEVVHHVILEHLRVEHEVIDLVLGYQG